MKALICLMLRKPDLHIRNRRILKNFAALSFMLKKHRRTNVSTFLHCTLAIEAFSMCHLYKDKRHSKFLDTIECLSGTALKVCQPE